MVDKVPLFSTQNQKNQHNNESEVYIAQEQAAHRSKIKRAIYRYWLKIFSVLFVIEFIISIILDLQGFGIGYYTKITGIELLSLVLMKIFQGISFAGGIILLFSILSFFSRMVYRTEVWSTPLSYLDSAPGDTVQTMNKHMTRNTKNLDLLIGFVFGLITSLPFLIFYL